MSARSERRWQHLPGASVDLLGGFELCLAQSGLDRDRLRALGAGRVEVTGNLKAAAPPLPARRPAWPSSRWRWARARAGSRPAPDPSEDAPLLEAHRRLAGRLPGLLTILAPRHPERGAALAAWLESQGVRVARRARAEPPGADRALYLADTLGELGLLYRLAPVAFVGKSLVAPGGGQNPLEPARLGCPVLFGPHMANFAQPAARLLEAGGARQVGDAGELATKVAALLEAPAARATMAAQARSAAEQGSDALGATLAALAPLLERHLGPADASA